MKIRFIRTPRHLWPFNSEASSFWQPLGFAYLAAYVRENGFGDVKILDAPVMRMGWRSVEKYIYDEKPDIVCIGEEVCSAPEGVRLAKLAKKVCPNCVVVAGGHLFSMLPEYGFEGGVDYIIRGEGEHAFLSLLQALSQPDSNLAGVPNLTYMEAGEVVSNPRGELIKDLDSLPMPAYDLLPMHLYGKGSKVHKDIIAVEHSRGCIDQCDFCVLWRTMGEAKKGNLKPVWRTKSPQKMFAEMMALHQTYGRYTFAFVDNTWNVSPQWIDEFTTLIINSDIDIEFTIWARADFVFRDSKNGLLHKMVDAGLVQVMIGVERETDEDLDALQKHNYNLEVSLGAIKALNKYPQVSTLVSLIYGIESESIDSMKRLIRFSKTLQADYIFFIPLTPTPGTETWYEYKAKGLLESKDFTEYNFHIPVMRSKYLSRAQLSRIYSMALVYSLKNIGKLTLLRRILFSQTSRKRWFYVKLALHNLQAILKMMPRVFKNKDERIPVAIRPSWYED